MLNHEGPHSEYFEELCALAAGGQISEPELATLRDHLQQCAQCRSTYADFIDLVHHGLPLADPELGGSLMADFPSKHSSYRERFLARARRQGVTVPQAAPRDSFLSRLAIWLWPVGYAKAATAAIGLLLLAVGILGYSLRRSDARSKALAADLAAISRRLSEPGVREAGSVLESRLPASQPAEAAPATPAALPPSSLTDIKLAKARQDYAAAEAHAKALEAQLQTAASELALVRSQRQEANDSRNQVEQKLTDAQKALAGLCIVLRGLGSNVRRHADVILRTAGLAPDEPGLAGIRSVRPAALAAGSGLVIIGLGLGAHCSTDTHVVVRPAGFTPHVTRAARLGTIH